MRPLFKYVSSVCDFTLYSPIPFLDSAYPSWPPTLRVSTASMWTNHRHRHKTILKYTSAFLRSVLVST